MGLSLVQGIMTPPVEPELGIAPVGAKYLVHQQGPPKPACDDERYKTVKALNLINAPPDPEVDSILKLVASIFHAPAVLCAFFDDRKIFIRDSQGAFGRGDFPWRWSFCGWTMASQTHQTMVIEDATKDARFADNKMVVDPSGPGVRFYCGTPLVASNGHRIGVLCFADVKPRVFDAAQCVILSNLAEMAIRHIEKDIALQLKQRDNSLLSEAYAKLKRAVDCFDHCVVLLDTANPGWTIMYANAAFTKATGVEREEAVNCLVQDVLETITGGAIPSKEHISLVKSVKEFQVDGVRMKDKMGKQRLVARFKPAFKAPLPNAVPVGVPAFIRDTSDANMQRYFFMTLEDAAANKRLAHLELSGSSSVCSSDMPIEGLTVGQLLGKGAFGSVYAGAWYGTKVAVKVIDQDVRSMEATEGVPMEAILGAELRHPHVVSTLKYQVKKMGILHDVSMGIFTDDSAKAASHADTATIEGSAPADLDGPLNGPACPGSNNGQGCWAVINLDNSAAHSSFLSDNTLGSRHCLWSAPNSLMVDAAPAQRTPVDHYQTWIIMEHCDKGTLQDAVDKGWLQDVCSHRDGQPNVEAILITAHEVASALSYLHSKSIIHGDLSAWNVMLTSNGPDASLGNRNFVAKIADFGLSRNLDIKTKIQTKTYGTLTHMPPETLTQGVISKATDCFSFGVLMWQMYTSSRPYAGLSHGQIIMQVVSNASCLQFPANAPPSYVALSNRCMAFSASDRPTMEQVVAELEVMQQELSGKPLL